MRPSSDESSDDESSLEHVAKAASMKIQQQQKALSANRKHHIQSGRYVLAPYMAFILATLLILFLSPMGDDPTMYPVTGGVLGLFSSSYVMLAYLFGGRKARGPPLALLFWRSFCDFGLSIRFVASHAFHVLVCGNQVCNVFSGHDDQNMCGVPSAMFEFFEMASEMWFLCIAFDLLISISNPFSTFNSRMKYYHTFVWITATIFALPVWVDHQIGGYWYVKGKLGFVDTSVFCWLKMQKAGVGGDHVSWVPWVFFYFPLMTIYVFSACVLYFAYGRLKKGVSNTLIHRLRVLVINSINLTSCFLYWLVLLVVYSSVYAAVDTDLTASRFLLKLLRYLIPAKGVSGVTVWVLVMSIDIEGLGGVRDEDEDNMIDLNSALRQEVLLYSQGGIQVCAMHMSEKAEEYSSREKLTTYLSHGIKSSQGDDTFTPWFFLRLILGFQDQIDKVANLIAQKDIKMKSALQKKRHSLTEMDRPAFLAEMARNSLSGDATAGRPDSLRMSQRDTVVAGTPLVRLDPAKKGATTSADKAHTQSHAHQPSTLMHESSERDDSMDSNPSDDKLGRLPPSMFASSRTAQSHRNSDTNESNRDRSTDIEMSFFGSTAADSPGKEGQTVAREADSMANDGGKPNFVFAKEELVDEAAPHSAWDLSSMAKLASKACVNCLRAYTGVGNAVMRESDQVSFTEFRPYLFRRIRLAAGLTDEMYCEQFKKTIKERLTQGGSSGAFFFFSKDESLIAKSCTEEELDNLSSSAKQYSDYICENSKSFISRIYGVYRLRIYGTSLHFFVMNNIFLNNQGHAPDKLEKYDLKGSWVARNAALPRPGDKVTCKLCQQKFIYRKKRRKLRGALMSPTPSAPSTPNPSRDAADPEDPQSQSQSQSQPGSSNANPAEAGGGGITSPMHRMSKRLGSLSLRALNGPLSGGGASAPSPNPNGDPSSILIAAATAAALSAPSPDDCPVSPLRAHEAAVILKDNDLKSKLYLPPDKAREVLDQLRRDAAFLRKIKVMDYSLLSK